MMISTGVFWGLSKKLEYVAAAINPLIEPLVKAVGFKPVGPSYFDKKHGVNVLPTLLEMGSIDAIFLPKWPISRDSIVPCGPLTGNCSKRERKSSKEGRPAGPLMSWWTEK